MNPLQNLHLAIGELAYAVACCDGCVRKEERSRFHDLVAAELRCKDYDFDLSEIIFQILDKDQIDSTTSYDRAMKEIRSNSHYLSPKLKDTFIRVMEKVGKAYPTVTGVEKGLIEKFKKDIAPIKGDPLFYKV